MAPIIDQYGFPCFIPVSAGWTMNEQGASDAIWILEGVMTMVPGMPVLSRFEFVGVSIILRNRTLRHTVDSISFICMKLTNPMPMNRGSVVWMIVGNMDGLGENQVSFLFKDYEMLQCRIPAR